MRRMAAAVMVTLMAVALWWSSRAPTLGPEGLGLELRVGQRLSYALDYEGRELVAMPGEGDDFAGGTIEVGTRIDARVVIEVLERRRDHWLLSWTIDELHDASLSMGGKSAVAQGDGELRSMLEGHDVVVALGFDGAVRRVLLDRGDPEPFRALAKLLVAETQLVLGPPGSEAWEVREDAGLGSVTTAIEVMAVEGDEARLRTQRGEYSQLLALPWVEDLGEMTQEHEHEAEVVLEGFVRSIESSERLEVRRGERILLSSEARLSWRWLSTEQVPRRREIDEVIARREAVGLGEVPASPTAESEAWRSQAGEMTWARIEARVRGFDAERLTEDDHGPFVWQATGLLTLHPELCEGMVALFEDESTTADGRLLALDLLTITGHGPAQDVLRRLLSSPRATADDEVHGLMLQRLSRVEAPDAETARFLLERYGEVERPNEQVAATLAMGSVLRKLPEGSVEQQVLYDRLVEDLSRAARPEDQVRMLHGLTNAGQADNVTLALEHANEEDPRVRAAAALSLTKVEGGDAAAVLGEMVGDRDTRVQTTALRALGDRELDAEAREAVGDQILEGLDPRSHWAAFHLVRTFPADERRRELAADLARRSGDDPRLQSKLVALSQAPAL